MTQALHVVFKVEVHDEQYKYSSKYSGEADLKMQIPRLLLDHIEPGTLFLGVLAAALENFDVAMAELEAKPDEEEPELG